MRVPRRSSDGTLQQILVKRQTGPAEWCPSLHGAELDGRLFEGKKEVRSRSCALQTTQTSSPRSAS